MTIVSPAGSSCRAQSLVETGGPELRPSSSRVTPNPTMPPPDPETTSGSGSWWLSSATTVISSPAAATAGSTVAASVILPL
jgi:hypothetical protein